MNTESIEYKERTCSNCPRDTEYVCLTCHTDLCKQCIESHARDHKTIDHDVVKNSQHPYCFRNQMQCARHLYSCQDVAEDSKPCELPVCFQCQKDKSHGIADCATCERKRQQLKRTCRIIREKEHICRRFYLRDIKQDIENCQTMCSVYKEEMMGKTRKLIKRIDNMTSNVDFKHRCSKQKKRANVHIVRLHKYEHMYEQSATTPVQFLLSIKKYILPQKHLTRHTSHFSLSEFLNKKYVKEFLSKIQITKRRTRHIGNERLLKLMPGPDLFQSFTVTNVRQINHLSFSCITSDRVWVSDDRNNIILTNKKGDILHRMEDVINGHGVHTVNSESELIYIDRNHNINKLSVDLETSITVIWTQLLNTQKPRCVYCSDYTKDLLVGVSKESPRAGKIIRFNQKGHMTQTIQHDKTGHDLYREPLYVTENNNGDIVVSDYNNSIRSGAVVVTEHGGRHRFSYTGPLLGSEFWPRGVCTDALSHIMVCDDRTHTVQMIDKDGQFLSHLLIRPSGIFRPRSLSYDDNTHRLWVGSWINSNVFLYRYITGKDFTPSDPNDVAAELTESHIGIVTTEIPPTENECMLTPQLEFHYSFTAKGVNYIFHISCMTSDKIWVSDDENLILTNTTGDILHRYGDFSNNSLLGFHTVNKDGQLIFIDNNNNINKLSNDMKNTITFIETTDSIWRPRCVYWSQLTGDLLVGMNRDYPRTGKVTRYNQSGQLTQTIQHDNTGVDLYSIPNYITENENGDVVVSDLLSAVIVTERGGRHRFTYTGHPSGSGLWPHGICTNALSRILICDIRSNTIHIISKNGHFLKHFLTETKTFGIPYTLCFDINSNTLFVGSWNNNTICVYRYKTQQYTSTKEDTPCTDMSACFPQY